jgi:hypothetical protein
MGFGLSLVIVDGSWRRLPAQDIAHFRGPRAVIVLVGGQALVQILRNENVAHWLLHSSGVEDLGDFDRNVGV